MQKREKILAAVVGGLVGVIGLNMGIGKISASFTQRNGQIASLEKQIRDKEFKQMLGMEAAQRMADWEARSLPADLDLARTLYQNWLLSTADKANLSRIIVDPGRAAPVRGIYHRLPLHLRARGTLAETVQFLHDFYSANHSHQVRGMSLKPVDGSGELELDLSIEAVSLPGATHKTLSDEQAQLLASAEAQPYIAAITGRNPFAVYVPPPPVRVVERPRPMPTPPPPPVFNAAKHAVLTAVTAVGDVPQAWFSVRTTGKMLKLGEGDAVEIGAFKGTVTRIAQNQVEIETAGTLRVFQLGEPLEAR